MIVTIKTSVLHSFLSINCNKNTKKLKKKIKGFSKFDFSLKQKTIKLKIPTYIDSLDTQNKIVIRQGPNPTLNSALAKKITNRIIKKLIVNMICIDFKLEHSVYLLTVQQLMQKYDILGVIGQGAYGVVLKCKSNDTQQILAIKKFKETEDDEIVKKTTMREVKILKMVKHPNLVQLKEAFRKKGIVYLVFEYVQSNLLEVLQKSPDGLDPELIRSLIYQLLKGLAYMHSMNIMHRDIKLENLLISDKKQLKICDFGFARHVKRSQNEEQLTDYVATRWYRPPELLVGAPYSKQIDIWAVGCILGQLIDGNPMFPGENQLDQLFLIQKCLGHLTSDHYEIFLKNPRYLGMKFPEIHNLETIDKRYLGKFSPKGLNFLKQLLKMRPSQRLTAVEALKHSYFDGIRQEDYVKRLSANNLRQEGKLSSSIDVYYQDEQKKSQQNAQRKKYSNFHPMEKERVQEALPVSEFNRSTKINLHKKPKEEINKIINSKGSNGTVHSKSVVKGGKNTQKLMKQKNISLQKHQNRQIITKTQAGFYIQGESNQQSERTQLQNAQYTQNKIYNTKSPKSYTNQKSRKLPINTEQILQQEQHWQSPSQLPLILIGQKQKLEKTKVQSHIPTTNLIITNSTFTYKTHH